MRGVLSLLSLLPFLLVLPTTHGEINNVPSYKGYRLIRFEADPATAKWLAEEEAEGTVVDKSTGTVRTLIDVWSEPSHKDNNTDVLVAPEHLATFMSALRKRGITHVEFLKGDVQRGIARQARAISKRLRKRRSIGKRALEFDDENYHSYFVMVDFMQQLARERPDIVQLINVSRSFEGRDIYGVKISSPVGGAGKPAIFVDAGIHAREWIAPATAVYLIKKLVAGYGNVSRVTVSLDKFDWYIVPQINPDGYEYSMNTDRLWRKTRSRNQTMSKWCVGADANRNWGYRWGEAGANRSPCSNIYAGSHPFSEVEIVGLRDYITWNIPSLTVYATLHSYGQIFLSPWGYTNERPDNYPDQRNAARAAVEAIRNTTGASYHYGTISELMYPASGTSIDFMQNRGVPYIYGVELRPQDTIDSYAFSLPPKYIKSTGEEMVSAMLALGEYAVVSKKL